nr:serine/threonine protein kinase [Microvirga terricola]
MIRGESGTGKSTLAREMLLHAGREGRFCRLVSDDRTRLAAHHGRLLASAVAPLAGCIEARGTGIVKLPFEETAVIRLVVDLCEDSSRYPGPEDATIILCGVVLPRILSRRGAVLTDLVLGRLSGVCDTVVTL